MGSISIKMDLIWSKEFLNRMWNKTKWGNKSIYKKSSQRKKNSFSTLFKQPTRKWWEMHLSNKKDARWKHKQSNFISCYFISINLIREYVTSWTIVFIIWSQWRQWQPFSSVYHYDRVDTNQPTENSINPPTTKQKTKQPSNEPLH